MDNFHILQWDLCNNCDKRDEAQDDEMPTSNCKPNISDECVHIIVHVNKNVIWIYVHL